MRPRPIPVSGSRLGAVLFIGLLCATQAGAQRTSAVRELERRQQAALRIQRFEEFRENVYEFFEISGEMVSFRVHPNMTDVELETLDELAEALDDQAGRMISYVRDVAPHVRGHTEGLWVVFDPPDLETPLDERLTLILALVNRLSPKIDQLMAMLTGETEPTISVQDLQLEASAPYFLVGGLEDLRDMTRELRASL